MSNDLLCRTSDPFDTVAVTGTAIEDGTPYFRHESFHQFVDLFPALGLCGTPIVLMLRAYPRAVFMQDLVQERTEVAALKLVDITFS